MPTMARAAGPGTRAVPRRRSRSALHGPSGELRRCLGTRAPGKRPHASPRNARPGKRPAAARPPAGKRVFNLKGPVMAKDTGPSLRPWRSVRGGGGFGAVSGIFLIGRCRLPSGAEPRQPRLLVSRLSMTWLCIRQRLLFCSRAGVRPCMPGARRALCQMLSLWRSEVTPPFSSLGGKGRCHNWPGSRPATVPTWCGTARPSASGRRRRSVWPGRRWASRSPRP
jgi:hypothetical protein